MAKAKTKKSVFDTTCTETSPGVWEWQVASLTWYYVTGMGINTQVKTSDGVRGMCFSKSLDLAVQYSWGYAQGDHDRALLLAKDAETDS